MNIYHIPIFVPHKGCPHDCVFCNQRHITGNCEETTPDDAVGIIEEHLGTIHGDYYAEIAFFGGSFTAIDANSRQALLKAAYPYVKSGKVNGVRCSTRPDYIDENILKEFKEYGGTCIELGVQSTDELVLKKSRRGHSFEDVKKSSELIKSMGIELGLQMMLGLPGDTKEKMLKTCEDLISLNPSCVRIYPTLVVKDTALCTMYENSDYTPLTIEEAIDVLSIIIPRFQNAGIDVIRVGLQTTDDINEETVAGPYHPAIKELAQSRIIRNLLEECIGNLKENSTVYCNPSAVSRVVGHKKCNKEYFKQKYGIDIKVATDGEVSCEELKICNKIVAIC